MRGGGLLGDHCARLAVDRRGCRLSARLLRGRRNQLRHSGEHRFDGGRRPAELRGSQSESRGLQSPAAQPVVNWCKTIQ